VGRERDRDRDREERERGREKREREREKEKGGCTGAASTVPRSSLRQFDSLTILQNAQACFFPHSFFVLRQSLYEYLPVPSTSPE
jgi:hypothetical protein